jgi:hypothetical protein
MVLGATNKGKKQTTSMHAGKNVLRTSDCWIHEDAEHEGTGFVNASESPFGSSLSSSQISCGILNDLDMWMLNKDIPEIRSQQRPYRAQSDKGYALHRWNRNDTIRKPEKSTSACSAIPHSGEEAGSMCLR